MILLAADTSGKHGSIGLARCGQDGKCDVVEVVPLAGGTFSAQLVPQVAALLERHGVDKREIGAFAVASGPGSFTGLRVGLAAIKALAEVMGRPIAAVSLLEAVAVAGAARGTVIAALDAGRGEIYAGEYEIGDTARKVNERLLTKEEFLAAAKGRTVVTPDQNVAELARGWGLNTVYTERPRSDAIAASGWQKIQAGETITAEALEANYIRRSDAEIFARNNSTYSGK